VGKELSSPLSFATWPLIISMAFSMGDSIMGSRLSCTSTRFLMYGRDCAVTKIIFFFLVFAKSSVLLPSSVKGSSNTNLSDEITILIKRWKCLVVTRNSTYSR